MTGDRAVVGVPNVVSEVPAGQVIDQSVAVVVDPVEVIGVVDLAILIQVLAGVNPDLVDDVRVTDTNAGVAGGHQRPVSGDAQLVPDIRRTEEHQSALSFGVGLGDSRLRWPGTQRLVVSIEMQHVAQRVVVDPGDLLEPGEPPQERGFDLGGDDARDPERLDVPRLAAPQIAQGAQ